MLAAGVVFGLLAPALIACTTDLQRPPGGLAASPSSAQTLDEHNAISAPTVQSETAAPNLGLPLESLGHTDSQVAWTVDDGLTPEVIGAYVQLLQTTDVRLTFFVTGSYQGWQQYADELRPFVTSGRVQLANHSWSHPDFLTLTDEQIIDELERNEAFLLHTFGVSGKPYYRPPMGRRDARTDAAAAQIGYTVPVLWTDWLVDSSPTTPSELVAAGERAFVADSIVLSHANELEEIEVLPELYRLIQSRGLATVTLNDVFVSH